MQHLFLESANKILIIRLSSLGDILLTTPVVRSIKKKYPHIKIDFLLKPESKDLYKFNPHINQTFIYNTNDGDDEVLLKLKSNEYDLVIDLQNNLRSKKICKAIGVKTKRFYKNNIKKFLFVNFKINLLKDSKPIPERYIESLSEQLLDDVGVEYFTEKENERLNVNHVIGFCPGSKHFTKQWPKEYYVELGKLLIKNGYKVNLIGGSSDKLICEEISQQIMGSNNLCTNDDLEQTYKALANCNAIVCNDSGLMHLTSSLKNPFIAIFGSTVREFGFFPYKANAVILEDNSVECRPCSHIGKDRCKKNHFECMMNIKPKYVFDKLITMLNNE